jgi:diguanylate cyclase (GGDEF)-like protein
MRRLRALVIPFLLVLAPLSVLLLSAHVVGQISRAHEAELGLAELRTELVGLQVVPWDQGARGLSELWVRAGTASQKARVQAALDRVQPDDRLGRLRAAIERNTAVADAVARRSASELAPREIARLGGAQRTTYFAVDRELRRQQAAFRATGDGLEDRRRVVAVLIVLMLALSTGVAVRRSRRAIGRARDLAAENAALLAASRREARSDALTGLGNRRALYDALDERIRGGEPFVLAMFDLDGFKELNDRHGHPAGDTALVWLAARLEEAGGEAYRLGGDELCLLAPDADAVVASHDALVYTHEDVRVTASAGWVDVPREAGDVEGAMRLADSRLYADKRVRRPLAV